MMGRRKLACDRWRPAINSLVKTNLPARNRRAAFCFSRHFGSVRRPSGPIIHPVRGAITRRHRKEGSPP